jgi:arginyl-tRNA synthetase
MNVLQFLQSKLRDALTGYAENVEEAAALVKPTLDARFGDYQANCAMSLAKQFGKKPRDVAQEIVGRLILGEELEPPEIAGPGFINLRLRPGWMAGRLQEMARDERLGVPPVAKPRTIVIDYSSPNIAKPLHVGHLRSTIIGDALARLFRFLGHKIISDNHLGDWGTQFGMILYGYKHFLDEENFRRDPVQELARLYKHVRGLMRSDEDEEGQTQPDPVADAARLETAKLHAGDPENVRLWQMFRPWCMAELREIYRRLDVRFDHELGESFYNPLLPGVVDSLFKKGVAKESQGAIIICFGEGEPPALVRKKDGAYTYTTTDLATIQYRVDHWRPEEILYVVDFRQTLHFRNLFTAARRWGHAQVDLRHISFGSVLGEDRRPLRTREGTGFELEELLNEAVAEAAEVYEENRNKRFERGEEVPHLSVEERCELDEMVGVGAVKYADLCQNRTSDYVFSLAKMVALNGNTATYMQYAYVRTRGILRKGEIDVAALRKQPPAIILGTPHERKLGLNLLRFVETLASAACEYQPSDITAYLWDVAKAYTGFFENCPVLKAETNELRESRLLLCDLTGRVIQKGLDLLGIKTPERM